MKNFPEIMGIVNVTPDSFSDGGKFLTTENAFEHSLVLIEQGADIIDIGGESSRPFSESVSIQEELSRVMPVIKLLRKSDSKVKISIDTTKPEVALAAIDEGADIVNDISGLKNNDKLAEICGSRGKSLVIMHMLGTPATMQSNPAYTNVAEEIAEYLTEKIEISKNFNVKDIIVDPGIGFGKTVEHNIEIIRNIEKFKLPGSRLLIGVSRKSFIGKILNIEKAASRDTATAVIHSLLLGKNIDIIRVHNVEMIQQLKVLSNILS